MSNYFVRMLLVQQHTSILILGLAKESEAELYNSLTTVRSINV
jgi:hypothetical protein